MEAPNILPTVEISYQTALDAHRSLIQWTIETHANTARVAEAKARLVRKRAEIILGADPKALGANEAMREAQISAMSAPEAEFLRDCEALLDKAKCALEVARIEARLSDSTLHHLMLAHEVDLETRYGGLVE